MKTFQDRAVVFRGSAAAAALRHLADNGPTPDAELRQAVTPDEGASKNQLNHAGQILRRLESIGLVKTKVWLTPAGVQELRRLGALPERAGVVPANDTEPQEQAA